LSEHDLTKAKAMIIDAWGQILEALKVGYGLEYENNENFIGTPERNARALLERCRGINSEEICCDILNKTFPSTYNGMIMIDPITVHSLCPHHFEDVYYKVVVAYIPTERCIGLSKIPRIIKLLGSQPILQEDFTSQIADMLMDCLGGEGVMVLTVAKHNCMIARGVQQQGSCVRMAELRGTFLNDPAVKDEFYKLAETRLDTS